MYTVYILQNQNGKLYKGMTNDLERRIKEHKAGGSITTRKLGKNLRLIYKEVYLTFKEARKRELYLKSSAGRRFLKKIGLVA